MTPTYPSLPPHFSSPWSPVLIKLHSVFQTAQLQFLHFTRLETDLWGEGGWFVREIRQMEIGPEEATSGEMACCYCLNPDHTACRLSDNRLRWMLAFLCMRAWLVSFKKGILIMILLHLIRTLRGKKIVTSPAPRRNMSQSMKLETIYKRSNSAAKQATTRSWGNRAETIARRNNRIDNFILTLWFGKIKKRKKKHTYLSPEGKQSWFYTGGVVFRK